MKFSGHRNPTTSRGASAASTPAAANVSADRSSTTIDGTQFALVKNTADLCAAIAKDGRGVLLFRSREYGGILIDLSKRLRATYGENSRHSLDVLSAPLVCAGCLWEFPASYRLSLQNPDMFRGMAVVGAAPGFDNFGKTGFCPRCGSPESLLVVECFTPETITQADIEAMRRFWRCGQKWWQTQHRSEAYCDYCSGNVPRGQGYLSLHDLLCESCVQKGLMVEGLGNLKPRSGVNSTSFAQKWAENGNPVPRFCSSRRFS